MIQIQYLASQLRSGFLMIKITFDLKALCRHLYAFLFFRMCGLFLLSLLYDDDDDDDDDFSLTERYKLFSLIYSFKCKTVKFPVMGESVG